MNVMCIWVIFPVVKQLFFFCGPPASIMQSWYFSLSSGMPPPWLVPSTFLGYAVFILTPLGLRGSQPVGQPSGSPAALAGFSDPTGLYFGLCVGSTSVVQSFRGAVMLWNTSSTQPSAPLFAQLPCPRRLPGASSPRRGQWSPHTLPAPLPPAAGNVLSLGCYVRNERGVHT